MTAPEIRDFRKTSKKLVEAEEKSKLLLELKKNKICLGEEENFTYNQAMKFKVLNKKKGEGKKHHEELVSLSLKYKMRDNNLYCEKLRRKRDWMRSCLESSMGGRSRQFRRLIDEVKKYTSSYRKKLKEEEGGSSC